VTGGVLTGDLTGSVTERSSLALVGCVTGGAVLTGDLAGSVT